MITVVTDFCKHNYTANSCAQCSSDRLRALLDENAALKVSLEIAVDALEHVSHQYFRQCCDDGPRTPRPHAHFEDIARAALAKITASKAPTASEKKGGTP